MAVLWCRGGWSDAASWLRTSVTLANLLAARVRCHGICIVKGVQQQSDAALLVRFGVEGLQ